MSRFRVFMLSLWVTCVCVGWLNGQERNEVAAGSASL